MRKTSLLVVAAVLLSAALIAAPGPAKDKTPARVKDVCKDCVDPYNPTAERARFFRAAGVDNELDAKEFEADRSRKGGFVRTFDTWTGILAFDKNTNATIDWFEADAYRRDLRTRVLAAYDTDRNRRLTGKERHAANQALAAGKLPAAPARPGAPGAWGYRPGQLPEAARLRMFDKDQSGALDETEKAAMAKWQTDSAARHAEYARKAERWRALNDELRKKHDANGDGHLDGDERKAYHEEYRRRAQVIQWDTDGDGKLSDDERQEMETKQAQWKKLAEEGRRKWMLQRWDKDKDGRMSEEETAAMEAQQAEMRKRAEQARKDNEELRKQHDADGDGKLDESERKAYYAAMRRRWELRQWDKNKDGRLDDAERKAMEDQQAEQRRRGEEYRRQWELRRWDKNKDGRLDDAERKAMEQEQSRWPQPGRVMINGRPVSSPGPGGVTVWSAGDGAAGRTVIIRRPGPDEQDK